jgi:hypothetical protein
MTTAVCFNCGEIKFGAFTPCEKCLITPVNEDDLAISLAMTDHYFDMLTLKQIAHSIRAGKQLTLEPQTYEALIQIVRMKGVLETMVMSESAKKLSKNELD